MNGKSSLQEADVRKRIDARLLQEVDHLCDCYDIEDYPDVVERARRYEHSTGWTARTRVAAMVAVDAYLTERGR